MTPYNNSLNTVTTKLYGDAQILDHLVNGVKCYIYTFFNSSSLKFIKFAYSQTINLKINLINFK
jgi:hypothetical protein